MHDRVDVYTFLDRPIAFHRSFVRLGVGVTGALFLSQAIYWSHRTRDPDGWFYKTGVQWEEEIGLTRREQDSARRKLRNLGLISEHKRGVPCRIHYKVNADVLNELLHKLIAPIVQAEFVQTANVVSTKSTIKAVQSKQTISEITTDINKETTALSRKNRSAMPADFEPTKQHEKLASSLGVDLSSVFPQFVDYHAAKGSKFIDWHAALRTWIRNDNKFSNKKSGYFRQEVSEINYQEGINDDGTF